MANCQYHNSVDNQWLASQSGQVQVLKDSSIGFRSSEYGGRYSSMISIKQGITVNKLNKGTLPVIQDVLKSISVMNPAVIHDEDTVLIRKQFHNWGLNQNHKNERAHAL